MLSWRKKGLVFDLTVHSDANWMQKQAQNPFTLILEDRIRCFFNTRPNTAKDGKNVSFPAFVDIDKNDFTNILDISSEPVLLHGGVGEFDEFGVMTGSVKRFGDKYHLYYVGWTRMMSVPYNWAIGMAISEDAISFSKVGTGPVIGATHNEPYLQAACSSLHKIKNIWHMWYTTGIKWIKGDEKPESVYRIAHATSLDGYSWNRDGDAIVAPVVEDEAQASPTVLYFNDKYHMFFSYRHSTNFRNSERGYRIGYASSTDLKTWHRDDQMAGLSISESGWDSEMVCYPHVFELNGKIYMLYCGNNFGEKGFGYAELEM